MKTTNAFVANVAAGVAIVSFLFGTAIAQDINPPEDQVAPPKKEYSPFVDDHFPIRPLFGDTHLHTSWSADAGMLGGTLGPDTAYRFARGETVDSRDGWRVKMPRPLDFIVVADHAENLGLADFIKRSDPICMANEMCKRWHDLSKSGEGFQAFTEFARGADKDQIREPRMVTSVWAKVVENADKYYQPGVFTSFTGFEWSTHVAGDNMHRVVIFRDDADRTNQVLPYSAHDSVDPEDLWKYMAGYEEKTGGRVLTLAHNGNLSNGKMFDTKTWTGKRFTREYAEMRARYEPLYEVTQIKGDGEAHPLLSPDDEFADFEKMDKGNIMGIVPKTPEMLPKEYARPALKEGLRQEDKIGVNPFKFGLVGSTDAHTGLVTTREDNFYGKTPLVEPSATRWEHLIIKGVNPELSISVKDSSASGLAVVWARENTREEIFDAMQRRETYATTGSRISVRVFGGWDFTADEVERADMPRVGYARGVPMGGDLTNAPSGKAPSFIIRALRDPDNANLDRVQVVKGWLDGNETHERIYDVACSDGRAITNRRCERDVGNTVDISVPSYTNTIGDPLLTAHWVDPDFDPDQRAFYYVRVIEIPKPRWTAYDAAFFGVDMGEDTKMSIQDRAYTSPIWYTP